MYMTRLLDSMYVVGKSFVFSKCNSRLAPLDHAIFCRGAQSQNVSFFVQVRLITTSHARSLIQPTCTSTAACFPNISARERNRNVVTTAEGGGRRRGWGGGAYSFVGCLCHMIVDHTPLSRRSTGPTLKRDTSNLWGRSLRFIHISH